MMPPNETQHGSYRPTRMDSQRERIPYQTADSPPDTANENESESEPAPENEHQDDVVRLLKEFLE